VNSRWWLSFICIAIVSLNSGGLANVPAAEHVPYANSTYLPIILISPDVYILPSYSTHLFFWALGLRYIDGEVQNGTANNIQDIQLAVNFYNSSGQIVATSHTAPFLPVLAAGDKTCFHFELLDPADWSYYRFEPPTYEIGGQPLLNMSIFDTGFIGDPKWPSIQIYGYVRNDNPAAVNNVLPIVTFYNEFGKVWDCDSADVAPTALDPGQAAFFHQTMDWIRNQTYSARFQVDGDLVK